MSSLFPLMIELVFYFQYVSEINTWNILSEALSNIQISQALYKAKTVPYRVCNLSLCRRGDLYFLLLWVVHDTSCFLRFIVSIFYLRFQVMYQSDQFLDKNKDYVVAEHQDLLSASKCLFVSGLFPPIPEETTKSSKFSSIGSRFKVPFSFPFFYRSSYPRGQFLAPTRWDFDSVKGKPNPIVHEPGPKILNQQKNTAWSQGEETVDLLTN